MASLHCRWQSLALLPFMMGAVGANAAPPRVTNDRYRLELVASEPEIVTPIGMAFDRGGIFQKRRCRQGRKRR